jgi:chorismate mutase
MRSLRQQVDRIDLKMLQLLQQRTKLSGQIGRMKHRHGAVVYVPDRERELIARLTRASKGRPPAPVVAALYREILSSSRAAQGLMPIGFLQGSAAQVLPAARCSFGACDKFLAQKKWSALVKGLESGALSLALLTGDDLLMALKTSRSQTDFLDRFAIVGDCSQGVEAETSLDAQVFIVTPRGNGAIAAKVNRILILIECKSLTSAIKSVLHFMPDSFLFAEHLDRPGSAGGNHRVLLHVALDRMEDGLALSQKVMHAALSTGLSLSVLGIYPATEKHGG